MFVILSKLIKTTADDSLPDLGIQYQATKLIFLPITRTYPLLMDRWTSTRTRVSILVNW